MAIAWVANTGGDAAVQGSSSSIVQGSSTTVTAGNAIVAFILTLDTTGYKTVSSVTDTAGNTYNICGSRYQYLFAATYYINVECWVALNITGHAANYVTANYSTSNAAATIILGSWSGMATSSAHDTGYAPAGNVDATSPFTTTAANTAEDNEIVIGVFVSLIGSEQTRSSSSPSVLRFASANGFRSIADNAAATAGSFSVSVASNTSETNICFAKAFKQAAAAAASIVPLLLHQYRARRQ